MKTTSASRAATACLSRRSGLLSAIVAASSLAATAAFASDFAPGSGDPIPAIAALTGEPGLVGGLNARFNHRRNYFFGSGNHPQIEFWFPAATTHGAAGYQLQHSADGDTWAGYPHDGGALETISDSQDNFSIIPDGTWHYRLLVLGGPKSGAVSNSVQVSPSGVATRFAGWSIDESMWITGVMVPWAGRGLEAGFTVRRLADDSEVEGALVYQWYRVHPHTYARTPIPNATKTTYVTTEQDVGGWHLMCEASGTGTEADGFARILSTWGVMIPNPAFATAVHAGGFRLNLLRAVPALAAADLNVHYYNAQWEEITLPVTAVTPVDGMAMFDVEVAIPPDAGQLSVSNESQVWQLATRMFEDHVMQGLMIDLATGSGFDDWVAAIPGIPADRRGPEDRNGPLDLPNLLAYAIGVNPLEATPDDLPQLTGPVSGTLRIRFRRATAAAGVQLILKTCADLASWQAAEILATEVLEPGEQSELVEVEVPAPEAGAGYFRLEAAILPAGGD